MRRAWIEKTGNAKTLTLKTESDIDELSDDEVLIDVHFSGLNFADIMMRLGLYPDAPKCPFVPGYEVSGIIKRTGSAVRGFQTGDSVVAGTQFGGYSSQIKVPQDLVFKLPPQLSLAEGAALPVNWITAHAALVDMGRVRKGDRVLVDSATGGVGTIALQMLKKMQANVVGLTSSESKLDYIRRLGAEAMTVQEFNANRSLNSFDLILNSQGGGTVRDHYNRLSPTGRVIAFGMSLGIKNGRRDYLALIKTVATMPKFSLISMFDKNRGVYALNALKLLQDPVYRKSLGHKWSEIDELGIKPHVDRVFEAEKVNEALAFLESKKAVGKVLLSWI